MRTPALLLTGLLSASLLFGCATAPPKFDFNPVASFSGDYDAAWSAVVEYFAVGNLPIQTIERDSGIIVSNWMDASDAIGFKEDKTFCDCGGAGISTPEWTRGKFNVFLKRTGEGALDLRVTCTYEQRRSFGGEGAIVRCNSTGHLEASLHNYVMAELGQGISPEIPSFRPGRSE